MRMSLIWNQSDLKQKYQTIVSEIEAIEDGFPTDEEKARVAQLEKEIEAIYEVAKKRYGIK